MTQVRIIHQKTGAVKYVSKHIADNAKLMKSYGFVKQDLKEGKDQVDIEELKKKYEELTGKKAGVKKAETLLREIEQIENAK